MIPIFEVLGLHGDCPIVARRLLKDQTSHYKSRVEIGKNMTLTYSEIGRLKFFPDHMHTITERSYLNSLPLNINHPQLSADKMVNLFGSDHNFRVGEL